MEMNITSKFKRGNMKPFTAKEITLIAILSASLTAGKLVLSGIPNVHIVTFLLIVYTVSFGRRQAMYAMIIFVMTEMLLYGFGTWIFVYFWVWPMYVLVTSLLKTRIQSELGFAILAGIFGLTFGFFAAVIEALLLGFYYGFAYWIAGIPFDIVHGVSNFLITLFLYKPVIRTIDQIKERM